MAKKKVKARKVSRVSKVVQSKKRTPMKVAVINFLIFGVLWVLLLLGYQFSTDQIWGEALMILANLAFFITLAFLIAILILLFVRLLKK